MSDIAAKYDVPIIHWSNTGKATPQLMRQLMEKHPNLYSSIKIRIADTPEMMAVSIFDSDGKVKHEWMALFNDYPDRFMIGSDIKYVLCTSAVENPATQSTPRAQSYFMPEITPTDFTPTKQRKG